MTQNEFSDSQVDNFLSRLRADLAVTWESEGDYDTIIQW